MKAAIITVPGREAYLSELISIIEPEVESIKLFIDYNRQGHWWNLSRCMREMLDSAAINEPVLIMCDDVITVKGWSRIWENIHREVNNDIYTFMSRQRYMFKPENIKRGYITKCQLRGFYDHAVIYINQHGLMDRVLDWFEKRGKQIIPEKRQRHLDVVIQDYLIDVGHAWTLTTPTLFDHIGQISSLGHDIGGSPCYIGNRISHD